jgi:ABC-2 type transport system permease protein
MNPALTIANKEYSLANRSLSTYIIYGVYLLVCGIWFALNALKIGAADMRGIFGVMHTLFLFFIPALTMGSIAKERSTGTLELISTLPIKLGQIVWGKFLGVLFQLATVLLFTLVFAFLIGFFGIGVDYGAIFTGYLGLLFAGAAFIAIGMFASSLTDNQVLAFIIAFAISGALFIIGRIGNLIPLKLFATIEYFGFDYHLESFLKGVIDSRDLIWFAAVTIIFILLAQFRLQAQNLSQER